MVAVEGAWIETVLPCLGRRKTAKRAVPAKATSTTSTATTGRISPPTYEDGLELALCSSKGPSGPSTPVMFTTTIVAELPSQPSPRILPPLLRSASPAAAASRKNTTGKRKQSPSSSSGKRKPIQKFTIGSPTDFRHVGGSSDGMTLSAVAASSPLTYPSPSRTRPENLTRDRADPSSFDHHDYGDDNLSRPRTAPSSGSAAAAASARHTESFPFRSTSLSSRKHHGLKLASVAAAAAAAPVDPLPLSQQRPEDGGDKMQERQKTQAADASTASTAGPRRRKPVPIINNHHARASSDPISPTFVSSSFAAEMLGSVPPPAVELEAPKTPLAELDGGVEAVSAAAAAAANTTNDDKASSSSPRAYRPSLVSLGSPTLGSFSDRLSVGALNILTSFPTTPKATARNPAPRPRRSQSQPRLRSNTGSSKASSNNAANSASNTHLKGISPLAYNPASPPGLGGALPSSPRANFPTKIDIQDLLQHDPSPFFNKSLPPTPQGTATFFPDTLLPTPLTPKMGMGFGLGLGLNLDYDTSATASASPTGKTTWIEGLERGSDAESIQIFLAYSRAGSPRRSPALTAA